MNEKKKITKAPENAMAMWSESADTGFENTDSADYQIPFLALLQKLSPQIDEDKPEYKKGASIGQFYDAATDELMNSVSVIVCHYKHAMVEWKPNRAGFAGMHPSDFGADIKKRNDKGQLVMENGNLLIDTRYFFCLRLTADKELVPCIIALVSSQISRAKTWLTRMRNRKIEKADGTKFRPPMWSAFWKITSTAESNDQGHWKGWKMEKGDDVTDKDMFNKAKETRQMFMDSENNMSPGGASEDKDEEGAM